eukprot:m.288214 g.288214  ORF g.288214 m.288214 type:complete len:477 (-) comp11930_c0_seq1:195-1625(-)
MLRVVLLALLLAAGRASVELQTDDEGTTFFFNSDQDLHIKRGDDPAFSVGNFYDKTKSDIEALQGDVSSLQTKTAGIATLEGTVGTLGEDVSGLKDQASGFTSSISELEESVATLETDVSGLKGQASGFTSSISELETAADTVSGKVDTLETDVSGLKGRADGFDSSISGLGNSVDGLSTSIGVVSDTADELSTNITLVGNRVTALEADYVELERRALDSGSANTTDALQELRAQEMAGAVERLLARAASLQRTAAAVASSGSAILNSLQLRLSALQVKLDGLNAKLAEAMAMSTAYHNSADYLQATLPALPSVDALFDKAAELQNRIKAIEQITTIPYKACPLGILDLQTDSGEIATCTFAKKYDNSVLKITWRGGIRLICPSPFNCGQRWWFTVNGQECGDHIDGVLHENGPDDYHRVSSLTGFCPVLEDGSTLAAGTHTIKFHTGHLSGPVGDAYTGWQSTSTIIIEEYPPNA